MNGTIGLYEIRGIAGRGAMGTVYDAWDAAHDRRVAVKTINRVAMDPDTASQQLQRFQREAEIARGLVHPNIVQVFDSGETDQDAFLVMEFVEGQSLKDMLEAGRRFTVTETIWVMDSLLSALEFSHSRGVVHRDIKPANVMINADGVVKLADFGVARLEGSSMTQTGMMVGTPAYMSPEQFLGEPVDGRSDVYSSGALLFQLLTGERPFEGGMASIIYKALHTTLPKPSGLSIQAPPALDPVVAKAMARNPNDRYGSAAAFAGAMASAMSQATVIAPLPTASLPIEPVQPPVPPPSAAPSPPAVASPPASTPVPPRPRVDLKQLPAFVEPMAVAEKSGGGVGGALRFAMFVVVLAGAALVAFDLYRDVPIGTLPTLSNLTTAPPLPGNARSR